MAIYCVLASNSRHRLGIIIYAANESSQDGDDSGLSQTSPATVNTSSPLAVLQLTGSRSRRRLSSWQRLLLPTTYVQDALDSGDGVVRLRVVCDGCDAFGRRLVVEPAAATARVPDDQGTPYLEVVGKRSRRRRQRQHRQRHRRHRRRLMCSSSDTTTIARPRC